MERFLTFFLLMSISSIWWQNLPSLLMIALAGITALIFVKFARFFHFKRLPLLTLPIKCIFDPAKKGLLCAVGAWTGVLWVASVGHWETHLQQPFHDYQHTVTVVGTVKSLHLLGSQQKIILDTERVAATHFRWHRPLIRLSWYQPDLALKQGQKVQLQVKTKPIHGLANEHGFHFQQWLYANRFVATGYVKSSPINQILQNQITLRQQVAQTVKQMDLPNQGWLLAMTLGYRGDLSHQDWTILQQTGTAHLVAISGLHVGMVAAALVVCLATLASAMALLLNRLDSLGINRRVAVVRLLSWVRFTPWRVAVAGTFCLTFIYAWLAGFSTPTVRAIIMLSLLSILALNRFYWRPKRLLLFCATLSIIFMPGALYTASFWLSFGAVVIIFFWLWLNPNFIHPASEHASHADPDTSSLAVKTSIVNMISKAMMMQLTLSLLMMPLVMWQMNTMSTVSPLANLIAVPLVSFVILPASLLGVSALVVSTLAGSLSALTAFATWILQFADKAFSLLIEILTLLSTWHWQAEWLDGVLFLTGWQWFGLGVSLILLCLPSSPLPRHLALFGVLPACSAFFSQDKAWYVNVLDVGQGSAVIIEKQNRAILIDTGAAFPSGFSMAEAVILPYLRGQHISHLDWVLISHSDNDHAGGLPALKQALSIGTVATNEDSCVAGNAWHWQDLKIEVLWPLPSQQSESAEGRKSAQQALNTDNNRSCVIRISDPHYAVLLPGDIELPAEKALLSFYDKTGYSHSNHKFNADLLIAPHHGSKTSSSMPFIEAVNPSTVVFSQGFRNRWQLPHQEVLQRYQMFRDEPASVQLLDTAQSGQIKVRIDQHRVAIKTFRQHIHPYWYAN